MEAEQRVVYRGLTKIEGREHYILDISVNKRSNRGTAQEAILYGLKTLDQILQGDVCNTTNKQTTPVRIVNAPLR